MRRVLLQEAPKGGTDLFRALALRQVRATLTLVLHVLMEDTGLEVLRKKHNAELIERSAHRHDLLQDTPSSLDRRRPSFEDRSPDPICVTAVSLRPLSVRPSCFSYRSTYRRGAGYRLGVSFLAVDLMEQGALSRSANPDAALVRRGMVLQWATVAHACLESFIALAAGAVAGSVVLFGFGLDALIEVASALIVVWRLMVHNDATRRATADAFSLRVVGVCFLALAGYILWDSGWALAHHEVPQESVPGIVLAGFSVVCMPLLARAKRKLAAQRSTARL